MTGGPEQAGRDRRLALSLCLLEMAGMAGTMTLPALLPHYIPAWSLTGTEAGWLTGVAQLGYVLAVPFLVTWTDRVDPRRIYIASTLLAALSLAGFALLADDFWTALLFRALGGVGLAGTYMPGLRILNDHLTGPRATRWLSLYTASYGLGVSGSVLLAGWVAAAFGVQAAFWAAAALTGATVLAALVLLPPAPPDRPVAEGALLDFRPVLTHRPAMGYILAYAAHCWELFGTRGWLVVFLVFAAGTTGAGLTNAAIATFASLVFLLGIPASVIGNELAEKFGRTRYISGVMLTSALAATAVGFGGGLPFLLLALLVTIHVVTVNADSASLTVGAVTNAVPGRKGATMAVHSCLGFTGAFLGPVAFGLVLDAAGGPDDATAWGVAFMSLGAVVALGPLALRLAARPARTRA